MTEQGHHNTAGALLKEARQARGHSLAEMSERTKIPARLLAAIEIDDYQKVAEPLYVKSFLRTYARCLDLDTQEILDLYNRQAGTYMPSSEREQIWEEEVQIRRVGASPIGKLLRWAGLAAVLLVLAVLVGRGLWSQRSQQSPETMVQGTLETARGEPAVTPTAEPSMPDSPLASRPVQDSITEDVPQARPEGTSSSQGTARETVSAAATDMAQDGWLARLQENSGIPFWTRAPGQAAPETT